MDISLRSIHGSDYDFLWRLHNEALREYVEKTWGWDEDWQRADFRERFEDRIKGKIITVDGVDAGYFWVNEKENEMFLVSIHLLPEFQNRGIGTRLITQLFETTEKPVTLQVLKVNPARRLYERLGFEVFEETETHFKMMRKPFGA